MSNQQMDSFRNSINSDYGTKQKRESKRSKRRLIFEIVAIISLSLFGLIAGCFPNKPEVRQIEPVVMTMDRYIGAYKDAYGAIMYEQIGDPASEGLTKGLPGLYKVGYITESSGEVGLMLMQFDTPANAQLAKTEYGDEVQVNVKDALMIVPSTSSADQKLRYLQILDRAD